MSLCGRLLNPQIFRNIILKHTLPERSEWYFFCVVKLEYVQLLFVEKHEWFYRLILVLHFWDIKDYIILVGNGIKISPYYQPFWSTNKNSILLPRFGHNDTSLPSAKLRPDMQTIRRVRIFFNSASSIYKKQLHDIKSPAKFLRNIPWCSIVIPFLPNAECLISSTQVTNELPWANKRREV